MTDTKEERNEVYLERRKIDTASGHCIEERTVSLKSLAEPVDVLLAKARKALKAI